MGQCRAPARCGLPEGPTRPGCWCAGVAPQGCAKTGLFVAVSVACQPWQAALCVRQHRQATAAMTCGGTHPSVRQGLAWQLWGQMLGNRAQALRRLVVRVSAAGPIRRHRQMWTLAPRLWPLAQRGPHQQGPGSTDLRVPTSLGPSPWTAPISAGQAGEHDKTMGNARTGFHFQTQTQTQTQQGNGSVCVQPFEFVAKSAASRIHLSATKHRSNARPLRARAFACILFQHSCGRWHTARNFSFVHRCQASP